MNEPGREALPRIQADRQIGPTGFFTRTRRKTIQCRTEGARTALSAGPFSPLRTDMAVRAPIGRFMEQVSWTSSPAT